MAQETIELEPAGGAPAEDQAELRTDHLQREVGYHLKRAYVHVIETFHRELREFSLRPGEFSVLCVLDENSGVTAKKLSRTLNIAPPNLVGLLENLERRDLIGRVPNPLDRRSQLLQLTDLGKQNLVQAQKRALRAQNVAVSAISAAEREQLINLLKKIYRPA